MKRIILSRKGFDSKFGGRPSPIFSDDRIFSIPIPQNQESPTKYKDLFFNGISGSEALKESSVRQVSDNDYCHYDPALNENIGVMIFVIVGNCVYNLNWFLSSCRIIQIY